MAPRCPSCSRELRSHRQTRCEGCGGVVDANALEEIEEAKRPKCEPPRQDWGIPNEYAGVPFFSDGPRRYKAEGFDVKFSPHTKQPPREVEYEDVTHKRLPEARSEA